MRRRRRRSVSNPPRPYPAADKVRPVATSNNPSRAWEKAWGGNYRGEIGWERQDGVMGSKVNAQGTDRVGIHVESNDRLRGKMIATIKSAVYFKGKKRRGVDPGSRVFACGVWVSFWLQGLRWGSSFYTLSFLIDAATLGVCANRLRCSWGSDC